MTNENKIFSIICLKYQAHLISSEWMDSESEAKKNQSLSPSYTALFSVKCQLKSAI